MAGTGEVLNLAVAPEFRRRGIGGALLDGRARARSRRRRVDEVFLEVRESNRSAQALYLAYGFPAGGPAGGVLPESAEDALVLRLELEQRGVSPVRDSDARRTLVDGTTCAVYILLGSTSVAPR